MLFGNSAQIDRACAGFDQINCSCGNNSGKPESNWLKYFVSDSCLYLSSGKLLQWKPEYVGQADSGGQCPLDTQVDRLSCDFFTILGHLALLPIIADGRTALIPLMPPDSNCLLCSPVHCLTTLPLLCPAYAVLRDKKGAGQLLVQAAAAGPPLALHYCSCSTASAGTHLLSAPCTPALHRLPTPHLPQTRNRLMLFPNALHHDLAYFHCYDQF